MGLPKFLYTLFVYSSDYNSFIRTVKSSSFLDPRLNRVDTYLIRSFFYLLSEDDIVKDFKEYMIKNFEAPYIPEKKLIKPFSLRLMRKCNYFNEKTLEKMTTNIDEIFKIYQEFDSSKMANTEISLRATHMLFKMFKENQQLATLCINMRRLADIDHYTMIYMYAENIYKHLAKIGDFESAMEDFEEITSKHPISIFLNPNNGRAGNYIPHGDNVVEMVQYHLEDENETIGEHIERMGSI